MTMTTFVSSYSVFRLFLVLIPLGQQAKHSKQLCDGLEPERAGGGRGRLAGRWGLLAAFSSQLQTGCKGIGAAPAELGCAEQAE